jgi:hypothetical protein
MTGDLSKFGPEISKRYGIDLNVPGGGLANPIGKAKSEAQRVYDALPEALKNLADQAYNSALDREGMAPLVPQTGTTQTDSTKTGSTQTGSVQSRNEKLRESIRTKLDDFTPKRDQKPSTTVQQTGLDALLQNQEFAKYVIEKAPGLLDQIVQGQIAQTEAAGELALKRDTLGEWAAITRAQIARDQALAQSLLTANVLAHTPNMGVIQALNQTAPSVTGAYKMGSPVLGK